MIPAACIGDALDDIERTFEEVDAKAVIHKIRQGRNEMTKNEKDLQSAIKDANDKLAESLPGIVESLVDIATDDEIDPKHQLRAIQLVMERVMGKTPERIEIDDGTKKAKWQRALPIAIVGDEEDIDFDDVIDVPVKEEKTSAKVIEIKSKKKTKSKKKE